MQDEMNSERQEQERPVSRRKSNKGRTVALTLVCAILFGLVAGGVTFGVNYVGNTITASIQQADDKVRTIEAKTQNSDSTGTEETEQLPSGTTLSNTEGLSVSEVVENSMCSMVTIGTVSVQEMRDFFYGTRQYEVEGAGTGVIVGINDEELLIATNSHVVQGAKSVSVGFIDSSVCEAYVKGTDYESDLAVVGVKLDNISDETAAAIRVIGMGNSDDLVLGEQVIAIGNALGYGQSVTVGYVSALNRDLTLTDNNGQPFVSSGLIQTDAAINSGNSGGALLNMRGELVGINEAKSSMTASGVTVDGVGYAIPIAKAEPILEELMALTTKDVVPEDQVGYLGINCADVTSDVSSTYNMPMGVAVTNVIAGSPAEEAGLKKGDVLVELEGRSIRSYEDLRAVLQYYGAGETVELTVMRSDNGEYSEMSIRITLADKATIDALTQQDNT